MCTGLVGTRSAAACLTLILLSSCGGEAPDDSSDPEAMRAGEVESAVAFQASVMNCLLEDGWPVKPTQGGWGIQYDGPDPGEEVGSRYNQALDRCMEAARPLPVFEPLSENEIRIIFDLNVEQVECLEAEGLTVEEPPSEEAYVATYTASQSGGGVDVWSPYSQVPAERFEEVTQACPEPSIVDLYNS